MSEVGCLPSAGVISAGKASMLRAVLLSFQRSN
jgi:hypothetical protein